MKTKVVVSILVSLLLLELVSAWAVPAWVRRQIRRRRRRNDDFPNCDNYVNSRCKFGTCFIRSQNYPDAAANFTNEYFENEYYCLCQSGYETYYEDNYNTTLGVNVPPGMDDWCNAEMDPCRIEGDEANVCQMKSRDNTCIHMGPNQFNCVCTKFWEGEICQTDVNECAACGADTTGCPCKNGAQCRNLQESQEYPLGFKCLCDSGTNGQYCEIITDPCGRRPCQTPERFGGARGDDACRVLANDELSIARPTTLHGYECDCGEEWGGANCEMKQGSCLSSPLCGDRGQCIEDQNYHNFYHCLCFTGYENDANDLQGSDGRYCTKISDLCLSNPCRNNATCIMIAVNEKKCVCKAGWEGPNCESRIDPCYSPGKPKCFNRGECSRIQRSGTEYTCNCTDTGYEGDLCQTNVNECKETKCDNAGAESCVDTDGSFVCRCNPGYTNTKLDPTCGTVISLCSAEADVCQYGGTCNSTNDIEQNFACGCEKSYGEENKTVLNGNDEELRCLTPTQPNEIAKLNLDVDFESDAVSKVPGAVHLTRGGGIFDNPYLELTQGFFKVNSSEDFFGPDRWFLLFFKSPRLIQGNLMTVHNGNEIVFEITPSDDGFLKLAFKSSNVELVLSHHSSKAWNSLFVRSTADRIIVELNQVPMTRLATVQSFGRGTVVFGSGPGSDVQCFPNWIDSNNHGCNDHEQGNWCDKDGTYGSGWNMEEWGTFDCCADSKGRTAWVCPQCGCGQGLSQIANANLYPGPFFNGGIGDLFYGPNSALSGDVVQEMAKWTAPSCKNILDLAFNTKDPYRDEGCMHLDPIPVGEEAFAETVNATNGIFPLVSFGPLLRPNENMKKYVDTRPNAKIIVKQFSLLFNDEPEGGKVGMMVRFRPTYQALQAGNFTFLRSGSVLQAGTFWENNEFRFFLHLKTENDDKKLEAILHVNSTDNVFCEQCVWSVVVICELAPGNGTVPDNLRIYTKWPQNLHQDRKEVRETIHTVTGDILRPSVTPLVLGIDRVHQIGRTMFWKGEQFSEEELNDLVLNNA